MAVSINPTFDITQSFSGTPAADRSVSQAGSSNSVPQWNDDLGADSSAVTDNSSPQSFLDLLNSSQQVLPQSAGPATGSTTLVPQTSAELLNGSSATSLPAAANAAAAPQPNQTAPTSSPAPTASTQSLISSLFSLTKKADSEKPEKKANPSDQQLAQGPAPASATDASTVALLSMVAPPTLQAAVAALPIATEAKAPAVDLQISAAAKAPVSDVVPVQPALIAGSGALPPPADSGENLAFQGRLVASTPATKPSSPVQPGALDADDAPTSQTQNADKSDGSQLKAPKAQQSAITGPMNTSDANPSDNGSAFGRSGSNVSHQQGGQDERHTETSRNGTEGPTSGVQNFSLSAPANQNNLDTNGTDSSSRLSSNQPIAHQQPGEQTGVKTEMSLKVQGQSGENVTVRLTERGGDVQVTVRSSDPGTSAMLRHELPSIQAGLDKAGWQLESTQGQGSSNHSGSDSQSGDQQRNEQNYGYRQDQKRRNSQQDQLFDLLQ